MEKLLIVMNILGVIFIDIQISSSYNIHKGSYRLPY